MTLRAGASTVGWVNTPVIVEAMRRHDQGRLPRSLVLWLLSLLEIEAGSSEGRGPAG